MIRPCRISLCESFPSARFNSIVLIREEAGRFPINSQGVYL